MQTTTGIPVTRTLSSKVADYDFSNIVFGTNPTDHMFICEYRDGGWQNPRIEPFRDFSISPTALCLHYGQTVFEGLKAYRMADGRINIFRPEKHYARMSRSLDRMCMAPIPESLFMDAVTSIVQTEREWIPEGANDSLYLRPFVIATEPRLGVKVADEYIFSIVCMPMGSYYNGNVKVKVETAFVRAVEGGTGSAKCGGNYGAAFYPAQKAKEQGFDQVLWTDGKYNEFIEESGTMNIMFIIDGTLVTPPLSGSILDGVTRDSLLTLARSKGVPVEERKISYKELEEAFLLGKKLEAFGVGTAAVISPIELIDINGKSYHPDVSPTAVLHQLKKELQDVRRGLVSDVHHWNYVL